VKRGVVLAVAGLVALQALGTGLGFLSWSRVAEANREHQRIALQREALLSLATTAQEAYVHQAHTFIEGGPGHLDHYVEVVASVDAALVAARDEDVDIEPIREAVAAGNWWFAESVVPVARAGTMSRDAAMALHAQAEVHAKATGDAIATVLHALSHRQEEALARATRESTRAWVGAVVVAVGGAALAAVVATQIVRSLERRRVETERLAALGEMASAVAHELMNPLAVILGNAEPGSPIRVEAEHARNVVQGLLGFARPARELPVAIDLAEAVSTAIDRVTMVADARDITVKLTGTTPATRLAAPTAVRQVLDNLLINAVQASPTGAVVEVALARDAVTIADRGAGVPPGVRARLYQPFVTGRHEGTGLGLAICKRIVEAQGGTLTHEDRPGGGTVARWEFGHG